MAGSMKSTRPRVKAYCALRPFTRKLAAAAISGPGVIPSNFCPRFVLLSQMTGVDNRELLPPYFPLFRNEDFLFGENLQFLHPNSLMVDFPWALPHLPLEERQWDRDSINRPIELWHAGIYCRLPCAQ